MFKYRFSGMRARKSANVLIVALALPIVLAACSDSGSVLVTGSTDSNISGSHTPHTGPADGIWPPQPENMTNAELYPGSARAGALSGVLTAARSSILNNPQVRTSLGSDYREIHATLGDSKSDEVARIVFYNYATDETVEVVLASDGSVSSQIFTASVYQPTEHPQEVEDAISLAQTVLTNDSFDVSGLQGTAMLAFPPASEVVSAQQHFYPQRMMYVTFGPGGGELPVYTALVNLSGATVLEHGLVK